MNTARHDRYSLLLLISLIVFLMLSAFVSEHHILGDAVLVLSMYVTLVAGTLELSQKKDWRLPGFIMAGISMLMMLVHFVYPTQAILIANWFFLAAFLGFVSAALFSYLGLAGSVTSGRLSPMISPSLTRCSGNRAGWNRTRLSSGNASLMQRASHAGSWMETTSRILLNYAVRPATQ